MKIIGKTDTGFLVDASGDELANLCAYASKWSMEYKGIKDVIVPGKVINVSALFSTLNTLAYQAEKVRQAQASLRAAAEALNFPIPFLQEISTEIVEHTPPQ